MLYTDDEIKKRKIKKAKIKNVISIAVYIMLIPLLVYNISLIVQSIIHPNKTPDFFGIKTYVIISGSMMPEFQIGDIVIIKSVPVEELKKGDVISFRKGQIVITHRISEVLTEKGIKKFKTKGDNNNTEDTGTIEVQEIEGKVIGKISTVGKIAIALKNKNVIISIVIFYYIFLLKSESLQKRRKIRRLKREEYENSKIKNT